MRYATAVSKLRVVTDALDEERRIAHTFDTEVPITAAYAFGAALDGTDPVEQVEVAFVVDRDHDRLPWGVEPEEVVGFVERHRLGRFPLRWFCRPTDLPVTNHLIRRPVQLWTREGGTDDAALQALTDRRLDELPRLPEPDPAGLTRQLEQEAEVCLRELDALVHRRGGADPRAIAVELFDLTWGYTDLQRALGRVAPTDATPTAPEAAWTAEQRDELRAALRQGDGAAVVTLLHERPLDEVAQLAGDGLLLALAQAPDVDGLAERCAACLRDRGWWGDEELAAELNARRQDVTTARREIPLDLDMLAAELEGGGLGGFDEGVRLHVATGRFLPAVDDLEAMLGEPQPDDWEDPDAWLHVTPLGSRDGYRDMELFVSTVTDRRLAGRLERSLQGRGVFRRFRDVLEHEPHEFDRWRVFSDERTRGRARAWLAEEGYRPAVVPRR